MKIHIWYHRDGDGFASAYAAWKKFGDKAIYKGVQYEEAMPEVSSGDELYILDFSYSRDMLLKLALDGVNLKVFDHHQTAQVNLAKLDFATFDMEKSGCRMSWEYFHPDKLLPVILAYIEDRDLWRFKLENSEAINIAFMCYKWDFKIWDEAIIDAEKYRQGDSMTENVLLIKGKAMLEFRDTLIKMALSKTKMTRIGGYENVPMINSSMLPSEVAHALLKKHPNAPFVVVWHHAGFRTIVNLRSMGEFDVSVIAKKFGGGGHKNAAGFVAPTSMLTFESFK